MLTHTTSSKRFGNRSNNITGETRPPHKSKHISITLCLNSRTGDSDVSAFVSIDISSTPIQKGAGIVTSDCDVTRVIFPTQGYYIRWTDSLPRIAVTVSGKAKYWCCCDKRSYVRQSRAEHVLSAGRLMLQGQGYPLSLSLSVYEFAQLQC